MRSQDSFQRWAAVSAIASFVLALGSVLVAMPAMNWDFSAAADPLNFMQKGSAVAGPLRLSLLLDMFGYYLMIAPLVMLLDRWLRPRAGDWSRLFSGCLLAYVLIGAIGASILAATGPRLFALHEAASAGQRPALEAIYLAFTDAVYGGIWNILEMLLAGVGWFGLGWLIRRERRAIGILTMVLGASGVLDSFGMMLGLGGVQSAGLSVYLLLGPVWALVLGISLLRRPVPLPT